jgi:hypothetical protein
VFPQNIEVESVGMYPGGGNASVPYTSTTVTVHSSIVRLPDTAMMPRLIDNRVGYFEMRQLDAGSKNGTVTFRGFLNRWRLEKKDPAAALSEPVKPIVFYIDPATPARWVPYLKRAIEDWQPAFEEAGFKNAIIAKEAPTPAEDPDCSVDDMRYSVIRWLPSIISNAMGPHISDPRSGEILNAPIVVYQNVLQLGRRWYFTQVGPLNPQA